MKLSPGRLPPANVLLAKQKFANGIIHTKLQNGEILSSHQSCLYTQFPEANSSVSSAYVCSAQEGTKMKRIDSNIYRIPKIMHRSWSYFIRSVYGTPMRDGVI